jgi:hypothetical protein
MELRLRRSRCHAEHLGDFFMFVAFYVVQNEHSSCSSRQSRDCFLEIEKIARSEWGPGPGMSVHSSGIIVVFLEPRTAASFALSRIEYDVHGQSVQPGSERALTPKQLQLFPRPNEHVLRELLGPKPVARHSSAKGEDAVYVRAVEAFEGATVSGRRSRDVRVTATKLAEGCFDNGHSRHKSWILHLHRVRWFHDPKGLKERG